MTNACVGAAVVAGMCAGRAARMHTVALVLSTLIASVVGARQELTMLHLPPFGDSAASGVGGGEQVGFARVNGQERACLWRGTAGSWVDLHPEGLYGGSRCLATSGGRQVGTVDMLGVTRASLWSGSRESRIELHPEGALVSTALGIDGEVQAGYYAVSLQPNGLLESRACLWSGSAGSLIDRHPPFAVWSSIYATSGGQHVGGVVSQENGPIHACLWTGNSGACVMLVPEASNESVAESVGDGQQGGHQIIDSSGRGYARLWSGTAESMVDLNPSWGTGSRVLGISGGIQVGWVIVGEGNWRACLWRGTAESCVVLPSPPGLDIAGATGVQRIGDTAYISGWAFVQRQFGHSEAVMWTYEIPHSMLADFNADGFLDFFDYDAFVACFEGSGCPAGKTADFNGDGFVDFADYVSFVAAFESGV